MNIYDEIAKVAHELFIKRGHVHGHDIEDWLAAERIVRARHAEKSRSEGEAGTKKKSAVKAKGEKTEKPARKTSATRAKISTTRKKKTE